MVNYFVENKEEEKKKKKNAPENFHDAFNCTSLFLCNLKYLIVKRLCM